MTPTVAALYVDVRRGPYVNIPGVDCWGIDRDATLYAGPHPVVAHPPCAAWGRYSWKAKDDGETGPVAVSQVRLWGGVLEHPRDSKLWRECGLPLPGEDADDFGGWTLAVRQVDFGHRAEKPTWLYIAGTCTVPALPPRREPQKPKPYRSGVTPNGILETLSKSERRLTPPAFALWLVELARSTTRPT